MLARICKITFRLLYVYFCYLNLVGILTWKRFTVSSRFKTYLCVPYGTESFLQIQEARMDIRIPGFAAVMARLGHDLLLWMLLQVFSEDSEPRLRYIMCKLFWPLKLFWVLLNIQGFVFILVCHHQLDLLTRGLDLKPATELLYDYKYRFLKQTFVFISTIIFWSEKHRLHKNYLNALWYKTTFESIDLIT
ncbi:hypothetical protein KR222_000517 [Zaprionus bogoriensis]|nr:hypothetical protein KR222_000517 [Zaprionus bogoriensis]